MKPTKTPTKSKGLTDKQLVEKYEAGNIPLVKILKGVMVTTNVAEKAKQSKSTKN